MVGVSAESANCCHDRAMWDDRVVPSSVATRLIPTSLVRQISRIRVISLKKSRIFTSLCNNTEYPIEFLPWRSPIFALISPCAVTEKPQPTSGTAKKAPDLGRPWDGKPCVAMHSSMDSRLRWLSASVRMPGPSGSLLQGLLLLVCLWWAMASRQGEALRRGPAPRADVPAESPVATEINSSSQTSPHDARILGSPDGAGSYNSTCCCAAVGGDSVPRSVGCGYAALGDQQSNPATRAGGGRRGADRSCALVRVRVRRSIGRLSSRDGLWGFQAFSHPQSGRMGTIDRRSALAAPRPSTF